MIKKNIWVCQEKETSYYSTWVCQGNLRLEKRISTEIGEDFDLRKAKKRNCANYFLG